MSDNNKIYADGGQLLVASSNMSALAAASTSLTITVPAGRGVVKKLCITVGNNTPADLNNGLLTLLVNSIQVIQNTPLTYFGSNYENRKEFSVMIPEASIIDVRVVNAGAVALPVNINLQFVDQD